MAINAQFPSWITESRIAEAQLGQQMGRNILEGLRFQEQKRQYEEMKPMRDAQMELNRANTTSQLLQNQQQLSALNRQNEVNASMAEALNLESGINRSQGGWVAPENKAIYLDFVKRNPSLAGSQWDQNMRRQFDTADKMAFEERKYKDLIEGRKQVAETRMLFNDRNTSQATWDEVTNLMGQGLNEIEALKMLRDNAQGAYSGKVKMNADALISQLSSLKREGIPYTQTDVEEFWSKISTGGGAMTADRTQINNVKSEDKSFVLLDQAASEIEKFDRKYGKGAFDDYVGPFDARRLKFQNIAINKQDVPEASKEANRIFQKVSQVIQGYRRDQFGTALTANETAAFKDIISDPTFANYADSLRGFRDNLSDSLGYSVNQYKLSPLLPIDIKKRWASAYQGVGGATGQGAQIPTGQSQPASSGIKIIGITPLP
jgi:hypothetical protein